MTSRTRLGLGGLAIEVESSPQVQSALAARYQRFVDARAGAADLSLTIGAAGEFDQELRLDQALALSRPGGRVRLAGDGVEGELDLALRRGFLDGARHLGDVDALLRLGLSLLLPGRGALLLHGAAVPGAGGAVILLGDSGAGKSTAAAALGPALSDELVVLHVAAREVEGTPYWGGRPARAAARAIHLLSRGAPERVLLTGANALRQVQRHAVRYLADAAVDRAVFELAAECCRALPIWSLRCPEGAAFVPYLRQALASVAR